MGMANSDFLRCVGADMDLIMNVERFAPTDLDRSRFEKECNYCRAPIVTTWADFSCVR